MADRINSNCLRRAVAGLVLAFAVVFGGKVDAWEQNPNNGHYYQLLSPTDWFDARDQAQALGGYLASITDATENQWVLDTFVAPGSIEIFWIGFTDEDVEGTFEWLSGEPFSYTNWSPGNPDDLTGQDYGTFNHSANVQQGLWDDAQSTFSYRGIVERDTPPMPLDTPTILIVTLTVLSCMGILQVRRRRHVRAHQ